jgi:tetratricopeptide (TPR) repeat protein
VLHLISLDAAVAADRFFYLPSAGFALLSATALTTFERGRTSRTLSGAIACAVVALFLVLSALGARPWASDRALYTRLIQVSPHAANAHRGMAEVYARDQDYANAARECRVAIQLNPRYTDAYELLGTASAKQRDYAGARQAFEAALRLDPRRASISANLGLLSFDERKLDEALKHFRNAAQLDPGSADIHYKLGFTLLVAGDTEGARAQAALLDRLDPAAAQDLRRAIEEPPGEPNSP